MIIGGTVYLDGIPKRGVIDTETMKFTEREPDISEDVGTVMLAPVNSHIHIGDSFIKEEPFGTLAEIVGPSGFKLKRLEQADRKEILQG
ncbi:N-ethylammeline chlorohydrolase, partial [mine drainage metagenome]